MYSLRDHGAGLLLCRHLHHPRHVVSSLVLLASCRPLTCRRINYFGPELSRFKPKLFYWIFIPCDLISLVVQAAGGGLSTASSGASQIGVDLALAGLSFQVFTIVMFCAFFGDYMWRYFRSDIYRNNLKNRIEQPTRLKLFFGFITLAIILTLIRCTYRLVELREGYRGTLIRDEPLFIALEGVYVFPQRYPVLNTSILCCLILTETPHTVWSLPPCTAS